MKPTRPHPTAVSRARDPVRDGLVVLCMTVVALALGIGLHLQFALAFWLAVVAALAVYVALLSTHVLVRRSDHIDQLQREVARLEGKLGRSDAATSMTGAPPAYGQAAPVRDYWSYAPASGHAAIDPRDSNAPAARAPDLRAQPYAPPVIAPAPMASTRQRDAEAEQINAVIKKLAADITQGQAVLAQAGAQPGAASAHVAAEVDASVAALHAAADAMRQSAKAFEKEERDVMTVAPSPPSLAPPIPLRPAADPARDRLATIVEALERERFDVMLEPILGLKDRRAQHFVVTVQLKGIAGSPSSGNGLGPMARGSGLLPLLDAVKVERAARVAWRMEDRGKPGALFSQMSGESLVSDRFLNRFADTYRQGDTLGGRLVLSFRQAELRTFSEPQWSTLRDMADLGFRFCLEDITDLDLDFEQLSAAGFTFAKLDVSVFLDGLPAEGLVIPAGDICRHFAKLNLAVIVGDIADEDLSQRLQAYGVELGQGRLFGAPRAVKADILRNPHAAVA
jgi:cyclic-di-GMP phosphodiesterase, flagellum assembly factor TipF